MKEFLYLDRLDILIECMIEKSLPSIIISNIDNKFFFQMEIHYLILDTVLMILSLLPIFGIGISAGILANQTKNIEVLLNEIYIFERGMSKMFFFVGYLFIRIIIRTKYLLNTSCCLRLHSRPG